jgi:uncharacterized protein (TIGR02231 family)
LHDQAGALDDRLAALDLRVKFIDQLAESVPQGLAKGISEGKTIGDWVQTAEGLGVEREKIDRQRAAIRIEKRGVEKAIGERQMAMDDLPPVSPKLTARIELTADKAATGQLTLGYRTQSAGWSPAYDISLTLGETTAEPKLELVRRAELHQDTGEDWSGVALALSTTRPAEGTQAPVLYESVVRFAPRYADEASESWPMWWSSARNGATKARARSSTGCRSAPMSWCVSRADTMPAIRWSSTARSTTSRCCRPASCARASCPSSAMAWC